MSANGWRTCPSCLKKTQAAVAALKDLYGKVSADEYEQARDAAHKALHDTKTIPSLREDYEIGIFDPENPELSITYSCSCGLCGMSMEYRNTIPVSLNKAGKRK